MSHERSTASATGEAPAAGGVGRRRQLLFAGGLVCAFLLVGLGVGLAGRFGLEYVIELFDAHDNPTANQYVGVVFLVSIFVILMTGALLAGVAGLVTGLSFPDRLAATTIAGGATLVGFFVMAVPAIVVMVSVLGGGGGGGSGGPGLPVGAIWKTALASAVIGGVTAYVGSIIGN